MIVCVCKNVSEHAIIDLLKHGNTKKQISNQLLIGRECKKCIPCFNQLCKHYRKHHESKN